MELISNNQCTIAVQADFDTAKPGWAIVKGEVWSELSKLGMSALLRDFADHNAWGGRALVQNYAANSALLWLQTQDTIEWLRSCYLAVPASLQAFKDNELTAKRMLAEQKAEREAEYTRSHILRCQQIYWVARQVPFVFYSPDYEKLDYEVHMVRPGKGTETKVCECDTKEDAVFIAKALYAASVVKSQDVEYAFEPEYVEY